MPRPRPLSCRFAAALSLAASVLTTHPAAAAVSAERLTPTVRAVREAGPAVVNIQGTKSVADGIEGVRGAAVPRQVNGMGTGTVIDPRGYILTNFHVVDGVRQINVTLQDGSAYIAKLVAHDKETDLAVIQIRASHALPTLRIGTSNDLLVAESVIAVGNAFGYENTVTTGIISALHRNVQVNETQQYLDLIQTDASINPGNSGGPLLNVEGEMIGVNVAVRAGAQGIGFAIPVDKALDVATRLISIERVDNTWHGMTAVSLDGRNGPVTIAGLDRSSPADVSGLKRGDQLRRIGALPIQRPLDVERALLGRHSGDRVPVVIERDGQELEIDLVLASRGRTPRNVEGPSLTSTAAVEGPQNEFERQTWDAFGMILEPVPASVLRSRNLPYQGGLMVKALRPGGLAEEQYVQTGDILIRVHKWFTTSENDVRYILNRTDSLSKAGALRFDIIRGTTRYQGELALGAGGATRR